MNLYSIIQELKSISGSLEKKSILNKYKDVNIFKMFMKAVYDPSINYYMKKLPKLSPVSENARSFNTTDIMFMTDIIALRLVTGKAAEKAVKDLVEQFDQEGRELLQILLDRKIGASVGDTMVLETWPGLYFVPPYQRCSLMDEKIKDKFEKLPYFYVQKKYDGTFAYLVKEAEKAPEVITRNGSKYPQWFADRLAVGVPDGSVLVGEIEVYNDEPPGYPSQRKLLSRQEGNGLCNAALQGREEAEFVDKEFVLTAWDLLTPEEFYAGKSTRTYMERLNELEVWNEEEVKESNTHIEIIPTEVVESVEEAYKIYSEYTSRGMEGAVIKSPTSLWKDGTSKDNIKLKIAFEAEYIVTNMIEGTGKASGMLGAITVESSDGKIKCNVGTGFDDKTRKEFWNNPDEILGKVVTIIANDVITRRGEEVSSLFLPVYSMTRFDKTHADNYEIIMSQLQAARGH